MIKNGVLSEKQLHEIEKNSIKIVEEAARFAIESPEPDPGTVMEDVFLQN